LYIPYSNERPLSHEPNGQALKDPSELLMRYQLPSLTSFIANDILWDIFATSGRPDEFVHFIDLTKAMTSSEGKVSGISKPFS
jgi:hypothetical protein